MFMNRFQKYTERPKNWLCAKCNVSRKVMDAKVAMYFRQPLRISDSIYYRDMLKNPELNIFIMLLYNQIKSRISTTEFERYVERAVKMFQKMKEVSV